jgi:hypothetical protein
LSLHRGISTATQAERISEQLTFIKSTLEAAAKDPPTWLLVAGHYPIYSVGSHSDTSELINYIADLFPKYNISAYLCGHDHISEHLELHGTHYFVSGAGSMTDSLGSYPSAATVHWTGTGYSAFSVMTATLSSLSVDYIDYTGTLKYSYTINTPYSYRQDDKDEDEGPDPVIDKPVEDSDPHSDAKKQRDKSQFDKVFSDGTVATAGGLLFVVALIVGLAVVARKKSISPFVQTRPKIMYQPSDPRRIHSIRELYDEGFDNTDESDFELPPRRTPLSPRWNAPFPRVESTVKPSYNPFDEESQDSSNPATLNIEGAVQKEATTFSFISALQTGTPAATARLPSLGPKIAAHRRTKTGPF